MWQLHRVHARTPSKFQSSQSSWRHRAWTPRSVHEEWTMDQQVCGQVQSLGMSGSRLWRRCSSEHFLQWPPRLNQRQDFMCGQTAYPLQTPLPHPSNQCTLLGVPVWTQLLHLSLQTHSAPITDLHHLSVRTHIRPHPYLWLQGLLQGWGLQYLWGLQRAQSWTLQIVISCQWGWQTHCHQASKMVQPMPLDVLGLPGHQAWDCPKSSSHTPQAHAAWATPVTSPDASSEESD